ncbi:hypothetical protein F4819DRAFT_461687 [Hypoxylon fuscum]|nr:hypothetical protein F4819DRAFT_461687 [Hypoxylon fuscum]
MRFSVVVGLFAAAVSAQTETGSSTNAVSTETTAVSTDSTASAGTTEAASTTGGSASATVSIDPSQSSAAAAITECLAACDVSDVNCKAKCIAVPSPDTQSVNATTDCVAQCPQGNGTASDNLAYADCVNGCIAQYYYSSTGAPHGATTSGASGASGSSGATTPSVTQVESTVTSDGSTFVTSFSSTVAPSGSGSADSASSTSSSAAAADMLFSPVGSGIGLFSFLAAFLAL